MAPTTIDPGADYWELYDRHGALWVFETPRYTIAFFAEPEEGDPADHFEFDGDVEFARQDDPAHWFTAIVAVYDATGARVGLDALGCCSYNSFEEFYQGHRTAAPEHRNTLANKGVSYGYHFPDMVRGAIREARAHALRADV